MISEVKIKARRTYNHCPSSSLSLACRRSSSAVSLLVHQIMAILLTTHAYFKQEVRKRGCQSSIVLLIRKTKAFLDAASHRCSPKSQGPELCPMAAPKCQVARRRGCRCELVQPSTVTLVYVELCSLPPPPTRKCIQVLTPWFL